MKTDQSRPSLLSLHTFFEKFDLFADAPDSVGKMRELVLQLAVQGRLVQQDRTEEPATVLLNRIRVARAALPANRRSGDETDTTEINEEATHFATPPGWVWTSLGYVQVFTNGYAFKSEDYQPSGVGIIRMGELGTNGEIDERNMKYVSNNIAQSLPNTFRVKPGDLLMGMSGSIGKLAINRSDKTYLLNQRVGRLEPILIEKAFLHVFLKTVEQHYLRISFGMAIKNLSTKQINETPFPLPPLAEQKRIVAKVDELMALCNRLEAQQQERESRHAALARASLASFADAPTPANLQFLFHSSYTITPADLRKSILTLAVQGKLVPQDPNDELGFISADSQFDGMFDIPESWAWVRRADLRPEFQNGASSRGDKDGTPVIVIRLADIENRCISLDDPRAIAISVDQIAKYSLQFGDTLITRVNGSADIVGTFIPVQESLDAIYCDHFIRMRIDPERLFPAYTALVGYTPLVREQISCLFITTAGQKTVNQGHIRSLFIPLPPLAEQRRIVAKVDQLMALVDQLEAQLAASRATAANLLAALVAELTTQS